MHRHRPGAILLILGLLAAALSLRPAGAMEGSSFSEGSWEGYLGMEADYTFLTDDGDVPVEYRLMGAFVGSSVADTFTGEWQVDVHTRTTEAEANAFGTGAFNGSADFVELELDRIDVTEPTLGISVTFTAEELPGAGGGFLEVLDGDCNSVQGRREIDFPDQALIGRFTAVRIGAERSDDEVSQQRRRSQRQLAERGRMMLSDIRDGSFDPDALQQLLDDTEGALLPPQAASCGGTDSGRFRAATTQLIDSLLFELAGSAEEFEARILIDLLVAGFRSGTFDSNPDAREFWLAEYERAVEGAIASESLAALTQFSAASRLLGRTAEADTIDALIATLLGES